MLDRKEILERAYHECMVEMYAKSQPSVDFNQLLADAKAGKIGKDEKVYERYYLSHAEFDHIRKKYIDAYNIKATWKSDIELLEQYLTDGGNRDKYIEAHTDEYGYHPGYRGYETVKPIGEQIQDILKAELGEEHFEVGNKILEAVMNTIKDCKEYYRFDREENDFNYSVGLGPSPCSNKDTVKEYWKEQGIDVDPIEPNPYLIWQKDYYGDEFEEVMEYEYGEDWKEKFEKKWEEAKAKREEEKAEWQRKYDEMLKANNNG
jgi:hypothetical protein